MKSSRTEFNKAKQLAIIPTVGITYGSCNCKFAVAFLWLKYQFCIRFFRKDY